MLTPATSKQQILAALTAAGAHEEHGPGQDEGGLAGLSMDQLAIKAGVSRATLYRLFGSHQHLLHELGLIPPPTVRSRVLDTALGLVGRHGLAELSMDELAAAAGVSRATLYRLFAGKEALFAAWSSASPPLSRSPQCWRPQGTDPRPRSSPPSPTPWPPPWTATWACCCNCCSRSPATATPAAATE